MTTSTATEVARRQREPPALYTFAHELDRGIRAMLERKSLVRFPTPKYQRDPVAFFYDVLGWRLWSRQVEIAEAVRDYPRVAVASGHKIGKSALAAGLALWFYCGWQDARVVMTSVTSRQVDQILWRELRMQRARSGRCVECKLADPEGLIIKRPCEHSALIEGEQGELARTGLKSDDFREIVGFTARESEAVAGISGQHVFYIVDEASGVDDAIFEAIEGNRAGGARIVLFGNPTRNEGEHFEAFNAKAHLYKTVRVSSEETPNVVDGRMAVPGLATREWCDEKKLEWGEHSPLYLVRVKGEHAIFEAAKIFSLHAIAQSEQRWADTPDTGRLFLGVDPAGESGLGDETCFAARRGLKHLTLRVHLGLNDEQHLVRILSLLDELRLPRETPVVVLDREGKIGSSLAGRLRDFAERNPGSFELVAVRASDKAVRKPDLYDRVRDELAANLDAWMRDGGAILEDTKLEKELHVLEWKQAVNGKLKLTAKEVLRKLLGRSPDRYDALALSAWEPLSLRDSRELPSGVRPSHDGTRDLETRSEDTFDPYASEDQWRR